jgi:hypothetical protein
VPTTVAPLASPLTAVDVGAEVASPLLPEVDEPVVEVFESPLEAEAEEDSDEFALPESPPAPVVPEAAEPVAEPPAPEPPPAPDVPVVLLLVELDAPDALDEPPLPEVAVEVPFDWELAEPVLPPVLWLLVDAEPVLPVVTLPPVADVALPLVPPVPLPVTEPELPELARTAMPPVPAPAPPPLPPVLPVAAVTAPEVPEPPPAVPPPAAPLAAVAVPVPVALPVLPDVDVPPVVVVEVPLEDELLFVPPELALPELPPASVFPLVAALLAGPLAAECSCAARTSSINMTSSHSVHGARYLSCESCVSQTAGPWCPKEPCVGPSGRGTFVPAGGTRLLLKWLPWPGLTGVHVSWPPITTRDEDQRN